MRNRRGWLVSILCAVAALLCVMGLSACKKKGHVHEWGEWTVEKEPTCSEEGKRMRTCSGCTEVETEAIEKTAHTYDVERIADETLKSAATCTGAAVYYKSCACGAVGTSEDDTFTYGERASHQYENGICTVCGHVGCDLRRCTPRRWICISRGCARRCLLTESAIAGLWRKRTTISLTV